VHSDDPGFRRELFQECIREIKETPNCLSVGLGDYRNWLRRHAREWISVHYPHDHDSFRKLDDWVRKEADKFIEDFLWPIRHRLIGLTEGNHYHQFHDGGFTCTQYMCKELKVPYLDNPCVLRFRFSFGGKNHTKVLKALIHHGNWGGGATTIAGDVGSAERKKNGGFSRFDMVLFGHTHRRWFHSIPELDCTEKGELKLIEVPTALIRTGAFVAAYDKCTKNYAQEKLMKPTDLGWVRLDIKFHRKFGESQIFHKFKAYV